MLLACCDKSTIVALEAIKGLAGASYPTATTIAAADGSSGRRPVMLPDEHAEADVRVKCSLGWQLLLAHAGDESPQFRPPDVGPAAGGTGSGKQWQGGVSRCAVVFVNVRMLDRSSMQSSPHIVHCCMLEEWHRLLWCRLLIRGKASAAPTVCCVYATAAWDARMLIIPILCDMC